MHQSKNPRCSELRKSFRISQRIAPVPVFLLARALEAAPLELSVLWPAARMNPPAAPAHLKIRPALAPFADVALTAYPHPPNTPTIPQPSPSVQSAPSYYPDTDILPVNTSCRPPGQGRQWWPISATKFPSLTPPVTAVRYGIPSSWLASFASR